MFWMKMQIVHIELRKTQGVREGAEASLGNVVVDHIVR